MNVASCLRVKSIQQNIWIYFLIALIFHLGITKKICVFVSIYDLVTLKILPTSSYILMRTPLDKLKWIYKPLQSVLKHNQLLMAMWVADQITNY